MNDIWDSLWNSKIHEKLNCFGWRALANVLPTRELLGMILEFAYTFCLVCKNASESTFHFFKECPGVRVIAFASRWGGRIDQWQGSIVYDLLAFCLNSPPYALNGDWDNDQFAVFVFYLFYCCWNFHNDMFFGRKWNATSVANALENMVLDLLGASNIIKLGNSKS